MCIPFHLPRKRLSQTVLVKKKILNGMCILCDLPKRHVFPFTNVTNASVKYKKQDMDR